MPANKRDGMLLMYSVPTKPTYKREDLENVVEKYDLDPRIIPKGTTPSDKFRKACRDVINRPSYRNVVDGHGHSVKLSWTIVPTSNSPEHKDKIQYDLMQQVIGGRIDAANFIENPVEHSIFKMFFHKDINGSMKDRITFQLPRDNDGNIDLSGWVDTVDYYQFISDIINQADVYDSDMDGAQVTEAIKKYMRNLNATLYRRMRAVWYVPEQYAEHAGRLIKAVREWTDNVVDMHSVPIYASQMAELREFFEERMLDELKFISGEISIDGKMQDRLISRLQREISRFSEVANAYDGKVDRVKIDSALAVVAGQMMLAMEANARWKEDKEAEAIRKKEDNKRTMKARKESTQNHDRRMSVL